MRICSACDLELEPLASACPRCGGAAVAIRAGIDPNLGRVLDERYEIRDLLGAGGMGTVYRAWQRSVGREVAIKLIHRRYRSDPTWIRRFLREAHLSSQLHHPNTVGIVDFGQTAEGDLFLAMELLHGRTLAEVIASDGPFDPLRTLGIGVQICDALSALHERRIIHRDLTTTNILILDQPAGRDHVKLLDFGLARSLEGGAGDASQDSQLVGTPSYMAPELLAQPATTASDLYGAGVILCEAHLGKRLFVGDSFAAVQRQKLELRELPTEVHPSLRDVLRALLEPDPSRRPHVAAEVRASLEHCLLAARRDPVARTRGPHVTLQPRFTAPLSTLPKSHPPPSAVPWSRRRRARLALAFAAIPIAGAAVAIWFALRPPPGSAREAAQVAAVVDPQDCQRRVEKQIDLNNGEVWTSVWYCNNDPHTPMYEHARLGPAVAYMDTINSWFVCYRRGERHANGDVWYYSQGDMFTPGWEHRKSWGYMAATNVRTRTHPYPGIPPCSAEATP